MASSAYEQRIQRYLAAHPGATRQEARGHKQGPGGTPEHGHVRSQQLPGGHEVNTTRSSQAAERIIAAAARSGERVTVEVWDKNHPLGERPLHAWDNKGHSRGWSAKDIKEQLDASGDSLREFLEGTDFAEPGDDTEGASSRPSGIVAVQITVY